MVPESIFLRDNNVERYFSFVMWRRKKKIKIGPFVPPPRSQAADREGLSWGTRCRSIFCGLMCPTVGDREAESPLPLPKPQITFHGSAPSLRLPTQPTTIRASQYHPFLWPVSVPPVASMLESHHSLLWVSLGQAGSGHVPSSFPGLPDFTDKPKPCGLYLGAYGKDCLVST